MSEETKQRLLISPALHKLLTTMQKGEALIYAPTTRAWWTVSLEVHHSSAEALKNRGWIEIDSARSKPERLAYRLTEAGTVALAADNHERVRRLSSTKKRRAARL